MNILLIGDHAPTLKTIQESIDTKENALVIFSSYEEISEMLFMDNPSKSLINALDKFQITILFWNIEGKSTLPILKKLRELSDIIILVIGAMSHDEAAEVIDAGADDQLPIPLNKEEFKAHINSLYRRGKELILKGTTIKKNGLEIDIKNNILKRNQHLILLSHIEQQLLNYLIFRKNKVVSKDELSMILFGANSIKAGNLVDMHITNLIKKVGLDLIVNIPKTGIVLEL